jgi:hypothetical protein
MQHPAAVRNARLGGAAENLCGVRPSKDLGITQTGERLPNGAPRTTVARGSSPIKDKRRKYMNELVQILMQKTGLPQDKAEEIVNTVVEL